jgi:hypothetical protein
VFKNFEGVENFFEGSAKNYLTLKKSNRGRSFFDGQGIFCLGKKMKIGGLNKVMRYQKIFSNIKGFLSYYALQTLSGTIAQKKTCRTIISFLVITIFHKRPFKGY